MSRDAWDRLPDRSERALHEFLDLCDATGTISTFFVVGEYARRFPGRVRLIADRGHEIACHSLFHDDLATQPLPAFASETRVAKDLLEQAIGQTVETFRAPSFSVPTPHLREFFGILEEIGFSIDSSLSSATRLYGRVASLGDVGRVFSLRDLTGTNLIEVGIPGISLFGREWTVLGGGYLRVTPTSVASIALERSNYHVLYLHAHDFDENCPRVPGTTLGQHLRRRLRVGDLLERVRTVLTRQPGISCAMAARAVCPTSVMVTR